MSNDVGRLVFYGAFVFLGAATSCSNAAPGTDAGATDSADLADHGACTASTLSDTEPAPGTGSVVLFRDNFDNDTTFGDVIAGGWLGADGHTDQDYSTDPTNGANLVISGADVTGHAIRLKYDGVANAAGQEAHAWGRTQGFDGVAARPGHTLYVSYRFRIVPGAGHTLDEQLGSDSTIVKVKWLELWTNDVGRAQFSTSYSTCYNHAPDVSIMGTGTLWNFYATAGGNTMCQAGQARPPWAYQGAGQWHRATHAYASRCGSTTRDGLARMWYDGTVILSVTAADANQPVPGGVDNAKWCQNEDLDQFSVDAPVSHLTFGSVSTSTLWPFSIDYDDVVVWRD